MLCLLKRWCPLVKNCSCKLRYARHVSAFQSILQASAILQNIELCMGALGFRSICRKILCDFQHFIYTQTNTFSLHFEECYISIYLFKSKYQEVIAICSDSCRTAITYYHIKCSITRQQLHLLSSLYIKKYDDWSLQHISSAVCFRSQ